MSTYLFIGNSYLIQCTVLTLHVDHKRRFGTLYNDETTTKLVVDCIYAEMLTSDLLEF